MKKIILSLIMACLCLGNVLAQNVAEQQVVIKLQDTTLVYNIWEVETIEFSLDPNPLVTPAIADTVDLGLTVDWATFNLGATKPSESGWLVGWGDFTAKRKTIKPSFYPTEYPSPSIIKSEFDVAKIMWGDLWRMPSAKEISELINNCDWEWTEQDGAFGYLGTSKINNATIFLPVTGQRYGESVTEDMTHGYYWSGILSDNNNSNAYALKFEQGSREDSTELNRIIGAAIRPVYGMLGVTMNASFVDRTSNSAQILVELDGDCDYITEYGVYYAEKKEDLNETYGYVIKETQLPESQENIFLINGLSANTLYYCVAYALEDGKYIYSDTIQFTTDVKFPKAYYVDLGLSVKWASWNIGATSEFDYGGYYGWGDPTGEVTSWNLNDYAVGNTSADIKGNVNYDLATAQWGDKWRMPTKAEFEELKTLTWTFVTGQNANGETIKAYKMTAKNGNYIIMPRSGWANSNKLNDEGKATNYWTSERYDSKLSYLSMMEAGPQVNFAYVENFIKMPIRAVYDDYVYIPEPDDSEEAGEYVDLGLSVLWGDRNVGAATVDDYGEYFAWGELNGTKTTYNISDYEHCYLDRTEKIYTKFDKLGYRVDSIYDTKNNVFVSIDTKEFYYIDSRYKERYEKEYGVKNNVFYDKSAVIGEEFIDFAGYRYTIASLWVEEDSVFERNEYIYEYTLTDNDISSTEYDVAQARWKGTWRMPNRYDIEELVSNCTFDWVDTPIAGMRVTGPNGNSIFLPAAGRKQDRLYEYEKSGYYWASQPYTLVEPVHENARRLIFKNDGQYSDIGCMYKYVGMSVRPVKPKK